MSISLVALEPPFGHLWNSLKQALPFVPASALKPTVEASTIDAPSAIEEDLADLGLMNWLDFERTLDRRS